VTPSHAMGSFLRSWHGYPIGTRLVTIHHAVDAGRFLMPNQLSDSGQDGRALRILSVSHGAAHKGQMVVLRTVAELRRRGHQVLASLTIDIRDDPNYVRRLEIVRAQLGLNEDVQMLGNVPDVERLYHSCDVMLFPSYTESFGFPLLEAMACGVPIVASAIPSNVEVLGNDGCYFAPGDYVDAADQVESVVATDPDMREARRRRLRARSEQFNWSANVAAVVRLVEGVM